MITKDAPQGEQVQADTQTVDTLLTNGTDRTLLGERVETSDKIDARADAGSSQSEGIDQDFDKENRDDFVPEDGIYDLVMPSDIDLDGELLERLSPQFKEIGLTKSQAQRLADRFIEHSQKQAQAHARAWSETVEDWLRQAKADKEIGAAQWERSRKAAVSLVNRFATPELFDYLNATGAGNHPELIRFLARIGKELGEDRVAQGKSDAPPRIDPAYQFFPDDKPK
ncbi:MAG: hypothetical protein JSC189_001027 [Candidatus Tokpelaia sp. JSC189]|nr:MAG: hypothetical protein JSC189_001027 [Candidatus Tokpelaia sp. JSC189]